LYELNQLDDSDSDRSVDSDEQDEDSFPSYAPHVNADAGIEVTSRDGEGNGALQNAARNLTSELRRRGGPSGRDATAAATGSSLFPATSGTMTGDASAVQTDAVLSHNRSEQEDLTNSLLEMAKQLKQQSIHFSQTLDSDHSVLDRVVSGLDNSSQSMDAAGQRMGTLRRMTEGKGWWDRMKLYAMIFGLWVAAFLIVFVGPKIRF
jgi:hypothetical protein